MAVETAGLVPRRKRDAVPQQPHEHSAPQQQRRGHDDRTWSLLKLGGERGLLAYGQQRGRDGDRYDHDRKAGHEVWSGRQQQADQDRGRHQPTDHDRHRTQAACELQSDIYVEKTRAPRPQSCTATRSRA